jgi:subtilase family serine protease
MATAEHDMGPLPSGTQLNSVAIVFKRSAAQQTALDQLLADQQDQNSPLYHKWLTPEQFGARFGLASTDLAQVKNWLESQGMTIVRTARGGGEIVFSGTAAQMNAALHTDLRQYLVNGETHYANATEPSVPAGIAPVVLGFRNLNNFRPKPHLRRADPQFTSSISGNHFLVPDDFATIYDVQSLYAAGFDGTGETIVVVGQSSINNNDITAFRSAANLTQNDPVLTLVPGTGTSTECTGDETESDLDVEWAGGVAKGATINFIYVGVVSGATCSTTTNSAFDSIVYAIDSNIGQVISSSYGNCEANLPAGYPAQLQTMVQQANAQGQTMVSASGDEGAADCDFNVNSAIMGFAVDVPAAIPEVTGAGGSEFLADVGSPATYWNSTNNANQGSAIQYIPEEVWNDTQQNLAANVSPAIAAGGGGASSIFAKPTWQTGTGVPADGKRDVPEISLSASANHDGYLICSQDYFNSQNQSSTTSCAGGTNGAFRASDGQSLAVVGGTSAAAPSLAGILAILDQATRNAQGNVNPSLYTLAAANSTNKVFNDVTSGNNIVPCTQGTPSCPASSPFQYGYSAGTGYDQASGWGSVNANNMVTNWPGFVANPPKGTAPTSLSVSPTGTIAVGSTATLTAVLNGSFTKGPFPTGTVQFAVDGTNTGSAVAVSSSQAVLQTSTLTVGSHSITAAYSGDTNYSTSTSAAANVVVADFNAPAASPASISLAPGAMGTSNLTITGQSTFTGTINLTCSASSTSAGIGCTIAPTSVMLTNGATSTKPVLTVTTTAASASLTKPAGFGWFLGTGGAGLAGIFFIGVPTRRRKLSALFAVALFAFMATGIGCGGGSSSGGGGNPGTPAGNYTITVTGTSGSTTHSTAVALTVT